MELGSIKAYFKMIDSVDVRKGRSAYMVMITKDWRQTSNQSSGGAISSSTLLN